MTRNPEQQQKIDQMRTEKKRILHELHNETVFEHIVHTDACLLNKEEIEQIKKQINQCPIQMDAIQFYAEMFEKANQNFNIVASELNAILDMLKDHHLALITILKKFGVDTELLDQYEPINFMEDLQKKILVLGDINNHERNETTGHKSH